MNFLQHLESLLEKINSPSGIPEVEKAKEDLVIQINKAIAEFQNLSKNLATSPEELDAISKLQKIIDALGNAKGS
jgi:DNA repair ATPase RecN